MTILPASLGVLKIQNKYLEVRRVFQEVLGVSLEVANFLSSDTSHLRQEHPAKNGGPVEFLENIMFWSPDIRYTKSFGGYMKGEPIEFDLECSGSDVDYIYWIEGVEKFKLHEGVIGCLSFEKNQYLIDTLIERLEEIDVGISDSWVENPLYRNS